MSIPAHLPDKNRFYEHLMRSRRGLIVVVGLILLNGPHFIAYPQDKGQQPSRWIQSLAPEQRKIISELKRYGMKVHEQLLTQLAIQGIGVEQAKKLKKVGVDVTSLPRAGSEPDYKFVATYTECVVIGRVVNITHDTSSQSCYHTIATIKVSKYLKRPIALRGMDQITIVQVTGPLSGGRYTRPTSENPLEEGETRLFFLSNIHIKYFIEEGRRDCTYDYDAQSFVSSALSPRIVGKEAWVPRSGEKLQLSELKSLLRKVIHAAKTDLYLEE